MSENRKPNALTIINLASAYKVELFTLEPEVVEEDQEQPVYDFNSIEDRTKYYENNGVYALGKLTGNQLYEFELVFKKTLDKMVACWVAASVYEFERATNVAEPSSGTTFDEDEMTYITPAGKLRGSPESNALRLVAFLFSCFGRVIGENERGNYVFENMSVEDMLDVLDYNYLDAMSINDDGADGFVWRCLNLARGFNTSSLDVDDEVNVDDETKNEASAPLNEKSNSTKSVSKTRATKRSKTVND